jgi:hypothetical protein
VVTDRQEPSDAHVLPRGQHLPPRGAGHWKAVFGSQGRGEQTSCVVVCVSDGAVDIVE